MSDRHFTREEVNRLIPELARLMGRAMERHRLGLALKREAEEEQRRVRAAGGALVDRQAWKARSERLEGLGAEVAEALQAILDLGGVTKDLEMGLVDFPGLLPGEGDGATVNLCWRFGETAVEFWHGLDEGYAQRKPLP